MNGNVMTNGYIRTDMRRTCLMGDMNTRAILYVSTIAYSDRSNITTHNSVKPDGAFITHRDIANNSGILTEVAILAPFRSETFITFY